MFFFIYIDNFYFICYTFIVVIYVKKKGLLFIYIFIFIFLLLPKSVFAETVIKTSGDPQVCDANAAQISCSYHISGSGCGISTDDSWGEIIGDVANAVFGGGCITGSTHMGGDIHLFISSCGDGTANVLVDSDWQDELFHGSTLTAPLSNSLYMVPESSKTKTKYELLARCPKLYTNFSNGSLALSFEESALKEGFVLSSNQSSDPVNKNGNSNNNKPWYTKNVIQNNTKYKNCEAILGTDKYSVGWIIKRILAYIRILGPVLTLVLSAIDFIKSFFGDEESMKKTYKRFITRLICILALLIIPTLVSGFLDIFGFTASKCNL